MPDVDRANRAAANEQWCNHDRVRVNARVLRGAAGPSLIIGDHQLFAGAHHQPHCSLTDFQMRAARIFAHVVVRGDDEIAFRLVVCGEFAAGGAKQRDGARQHRLEQARQLEIRRQIRNSVQ